MTDPDQIHLGLGVIQGVLVVLSQEAHQELNLNQDHHPLVKQPLRL